MDPLSLAALAAAFFGAVASGAGEVVGKEVGSRVAEWIGVRFPSTPDEAAVERELADEFKREPTATIEVRKAIDEDARADPLLVAAVEARRPGLLQMTFGLSPEQARAQRGRCPVGGEWLWTPKYYNGNGEQIRGGGLLTFGAMRKVSRSAYAICGKGHRWPVFAVGR